MRAIGWFLPLCLMLEFLARCPFFLLPFFWKWAIDALTAPAGASSLLPVILFWLVVALGATLFTSAHALAAGVARERASRFLRRHLFRELGIGGPAPSRRSGGVDDDQTLAHFAQHLRAVEGLIAETLPSLVVTVLSVALVLTLLLSLCPSATVLILAMLPLAFPVLLATNRRIRRATTRLLDAESALLASLNELVAGREELRTFGGILGFVFDRFEAPFRRRYREDMAFRRRREAAKGIVRMGGAAAAITVMFYVFHLADAGELSLGSAIAIMEFFLGGLAALGLILLRQNEALQTELAALRKIRDYADGSFPVARDAGPATDSQGSPPAGIAPGSGGAAFDAVTRSPAIALDRVTFAYDGTESILNDVSLALSPGEWVAILGPSGCGKTTLLRLIFGHLEPTAGTIRVFGRMRGEVDTEAWCRRVGILHQHPVLFSGTLRENLLLAAPEADDEALADALERSLLGPFLSALVDGLDTPIGPGGTTLSGGELRRLALARLHLRQPDLWLLDEPTAMLDPATGEELVGRLRDSLVGRCVLFVTHNPDLLSSAHRVLRIAPNRRLEPLPDASAWEAIARGRATA